jgi:hypothetical protein
MCLTKRNNSKKTFVSTLAFIVLLCVQNCNAQDDLLKELLTESSPAKVRVIATFKGNKIINIETNETVRKKNLDIRISHLFGNIGTESGGGIHNFYGLDQSADIRIGFHYGISDRLMVGVSHIKRNENFEALAKFRVFEQTTDNAVPLGMTLFGNTTYSIRYFDLFDKDIYRLTYCAQAIFTRKFSTKFSMAITPVFIHRNFVTADDENNTFSLSAGFRYKFTRSASVIADYSHTFGRENVLIRYYNVAGLGVEIETGGHVFSIMFTNAAGVIENDYLVNTQDNWSDGGIKFSFNISRMFRFGKSETKEKKP